MTLCACGAVTRWSTETTLIPRAAAWAITALSALPLDGLMMIALAPAEIRLRMSAICSAGPPLRFAMMTLLTMPLAARLRLDRADHLFAPAVADERVRHAEDERLVRFLRPRGRRDGDRDGNCRECDEGDSPARAL